MRLFVQVGVRVVRRVFLSCACASASNNALWRRELVLRRLLLLLLSLMMAKWWPWGEGAVPASLVVADSTVYIAGLRIDNSAPWEVA